MECPKFGKDMQPGFLQIAKIVAFNKTRHKISLNPKDKEDIVLESVLKLNTCVQNANVVN